MSDYNSGNRWTHLTQILIGKLVRTKALILAWFKNSKLRKLKISFQPKLGSFAINKSFMTYYNLSALILDLYDFFSCSVIFLFFFHYGPLKLLQDCCLEQKEVQKYILDYVISVCMGFVKSLAQFFDKQCI